MTLQSLKNKILPIELYHEIFQYLRPCERMILNEVDSIKQQYQNFVKTTIWPKLFKDLRPSGVRSCNRPDSVNEIKFETVFTIIKELNINEFYILECNQNNEIEAGLISHFIVLGKNITKVELMCSGRVIHHQFFLKQDIVKIVPFDTCFMSSQFAKIKVKVYADSVSKIFAKKYFLKNDDFILLMNNTIAFDTLIYNDSKIHMVLTYNGMFSYFSYEISSVDDVSTLYKICQVYYKVPFLKSSKKYMLMRPEKW